MNAALPIVSRELRVAARRRGTYWGRVFGAGVAFLVLAGFVIVDYLDGGSVFTSGAGLFRVLCWMTLVLAGAGGLLLTFDCISEEKRDGTLGLLFLTDLKGYDVVIGKLFSSSLGAFYGIFALAPVLGVCLLMGGVTGGEFVRAVLALISALFLAMTTGILISALSRETQKAMVASFALMLLLTGGMPLLDLWRAGWDRVQFDPLASYASPAFALQLSFSATPGPFWISLVAIHVLAWIFIGLASFAIPRVWQAKEAIGTRERSWRTYLKYGSRTRRTKLRGRFLDNNPAAWLAARDRGFAFWIGLLLLLALAASHIYPESRNSDNLAQALVSGVPFWLTYLFMYLWVATKAASAFLDSRRNGALELLLTSPLRPKDLVSGAWQGIYHLFKLPVCLFLGIGLLSSFIYYVAGNQPVTENEAFVILQIIYSITSLAGWLTTLAALAWTGLWFGLTSEKVSGAIIKTILFVQVLPWLGLAFVQTLLMMALSRFSMATWLWPICMFLLVLLKNGLFIWWARQNLLTHFQDVAVFGRKSRPPTELHPVPGSLAPVPHATT